MFRINISRYVVPKERLDKFTVCWEEGWVKAMGNSLGMSISFTDGVKCRVLDVFKAFNFIERGKGEAVLGKWRFMVLGKEC